MSMDYDRSDDEEEKAQNAIGQKEDEERTVALSEEGDEDDDITDELTRDPMLTISLDFERRVSKRLNEGGVRNFTHRSNMRHSNATRRPQYGTPSMVSKLYRETIAPLRHHPSLPPPAII
eukprot:CAMPEP_0198208354 /NCGR_PEP_ID=MMETSP1445-20131203/11723_1 /TAXON_ID=36898 /ORGANISM="Pyramimonas sp., Strain CCMP2087" /LENGTH=119 /DNA_ID=CAMNT_0043881719 /DNA_START=631 /DNA_END=990 /DNA_ORIENTATION=-